MRGISQELSNLPKVILSVESIKGEYRKVFLSLISCYTGKRYTNTENTAFLPGYFITNASGGIRFGSGVNIFDLSLKLDNIFNSNYQTIAWYPMPGRSFLIAFIYQFNKIRKNE
jgi:vitamin B12 transporter